MLSIAISTAFAQMAYNQGVNLFAYDDYLMLKGAEYVAKYNLGYDVQYTTYSNSDVTQTVIPCSSGNECVLTQGGSRAPAPSRAQAPATEAQWRHLQRRHKNSLRCALARPSPRGEAASPGPRQPPLPCFARGGADQYKSAHLPPSQAAALGAQPTTRARGYWANGSYPGRSAGGREKYYTFGLSQAATSTVTVIE